MTCELMEMDCAQESDKKACFGMFDKKLKGCINCKEAIECSKQTIPLNLDYIIIGE